MQDFARKHNQLKYYYFTWSRLILYYTKQAQYTLAQYELEQYMSQAEKDNYKPATADAYKQLGHIYRTRGLKEASVEYYRKAIDFMIQNGLDKFQLSNLYSELATMLMDLRRYPEAAEAIEKGKACIPLPEYIWSLKIKEVLLLLQTDQIAKAKALFEEIKAGHGGYLTDINLTEIQLAIYKSSHEYTKALATIERLIGLFGNEGYAESYFYYIYKTRADAYAALGNFGPAYEDLQHFIDLYHKRVNDDNEKTLGEFATLLDVNRLNVEKAELHQQAQEERLHRTPIGHHRPGVHPPAGRRLHRGDAPHEPPPRPREAGRRREQPDEGHLHPQHHTRNQYAAQLHRRVCGAGRSLGRCRCRRTAILYRHHPGKQRLPAKTRGRRTLRRPGSNRRKPRRSWGRPRSTNAAWSAFRRSRSTAPGRPDIRFVPACEKFHLHTSRVLISKAITEMLRNAVHFAADGDITLAYTLDGGNRRITFTVTDSGPGIPASEAEHIFGRFVKLDTFSQGLGLGLTVCRLIASALDGTIKLDTDYSGGARFVLSIPLR